MGVCMLLTVIAMTTAGRETHQPLGTWVSLLAVKVI